MNATLGQIPLKHLLAAVLMGAALALAPTGLRAEEETTTAEPTDSLTTRVENTLWGLVDAIVATATDTPR